MPLTKEQRIAYLVKAREAKATKADLLKKGQSKPKEEIKPEPVKEPSPEPVKVVEKPKKIKKVGKSLDLTSLPDPKPTPETEIINEEVVEVITEIQKIKKPKRVVKKIIKQEYETESDVEEVVVIEPPKLSKVVKPKVVEPKVEPVNLFFNY